MQPTGRPHFRYAVECEKIEYVMSISTINQDAKKQKQQERSAKRPFTDFLEAS